MNSQEAIEYLRRDVSIGSLLSQIEMPDFTPSGRVYYDLLESIVSQQLSIKVADVIYQRFLALFPAIAPCVLMGTNIVPLFHFSHEKTS